MFLTIVTVNYNNYQNLLKTLKSLRENFNIDYKHFIVDGSSNDFKISLKDLSQLYKFNYVSEKDNGIYDAMNKGVILTASDYLLFLNSGDCINNVSFSDYFPKNTNFDLIYSDMIYEKNGAKNLVRYPETLSLDYMITFGLPHPATIINRRLFDCIGLYENKFEIISDWIFFMEALFYQKASYLHVNKPMVVFDANGLSSDDKNYKKIIIEQLRYLRLRFPSKVCFYKQNNYYVKKYFSRFPFWKRYLFHFNFILFDKI